MKNDALTLMAQAGATFTLPKGRTKKPLEMSWQEKGHSLEAAQQHARQGGNVGLLCGTLSNGIVAWDLDERFPDFCQQYPTLAQTWCVVRDNAPERGKLLFQIIGPLPESQTARRPGERHPFSELLSTGRHALIPPSEFDGGHYLLQNADKPLLTLSTGELLAIWHAWVDPQLAPSAPPPSPPRPKDSPAPSPGDDLKTQVKRAWPSALSVFDHFGRAGQVEPEDAHNLRLRHNGGLIVGRPDAAEWCERWNFPAEKGHGGDQIDAWGYCRHGDAWWHARRELFVETLHEMAQAAGLALPERQPAQNNGTVQAPPPVNGQQRLKWGGWRGERAILRRGKTRYTVNDEEENGLIIEVATGKQAITTTLAHHNPDVEGAAATIANALPLTADEVAADLREIPYHLTAHPHPAKAPAPIAGALADFAEWINARLNGRASREAKQSISQAIVAWLLARRSLLIDPASDRPYMIAETREALPLDVDGLALRAHLSESGINPTEATFAWLLEDLRNTAKRQGERVRLAHWAKVEDGNVLVSCGPSAYIEATPRGFTKRLNGDNGVVFAADACLPAWDHTVKPCNPLDLSAFSPSLVAPSEVPDYTPEVQRRLLAAWLASLLANLRPLPLVAAVGDKGGGKSTLLRATLRLALGPDADVAPVSSDEKDFWTLMVGYPVIGLDNVDSIPPLWLPDALAVAATGGSRKVRKLYTTAEVCDLRITAAVMLSSRTATFARPDVAERLLPLFTAEMNDTRRVADSTLTGELDDVRDGALVYLVQQAAQLVALRGQAPNGLPARFLDFAELVWAWHRANNCEALVLPTLRAWRSAQALSIGDADPLLSAILEYCPSTGLERLTAAELVKALSDRGADIPQLGGAKAIARRLREMRASLLLAGWRLLEDNSRHRTLFTLTRQ
jgi:hypothetical protein